MNTTKIIRIQEGDSLTMVEKQLIYTKDLSLQEKGLLIFLLSLSPDYDISKKNLYDSLPDSKGTIDRVFKSLQKKGYILSVKVHKTDGTFSGWSHTFNF